MRPSGALDMADIYTIVHSAYIDKCISDDDGGNASAVWSIALCPLCM